MNDYINWTSNTCCINPQRNTSHPKHLLRHEAYVWTCWKVVATCWILIQLMLSNMCAFWRELWNGRRENVIIALRCKRCRCSYEISKKKTKISENVDLRMAKKQDIFRAILHSPGRAQKPRIPEPRSQFQSPCWIFPPSRVTPNSKTIGGCRSTNGNLLKGIDSSSILFNNVELPFNMLNGIFQHWTIHDTHVKH